MAQDIAYADGLAIGVGAGREPFFAYFSFFPAYIKFNNKYCIIYYILCIYKHMHIDKTIDISTSHSYKHIDTSIVSIDMHIVSIHGITTSKHLK